VRSLPITIIIAVALSACAAKLQTVSLVNKTDRAIEAIYIYPLGAADHGASHGGLAPNASTQVAVKPGHVEVMAVSAKVKIDEHTRDQPTASQGLELAGPTQVIFYDAAAPPAGIDRPGVVGISFILPVAKPAPAPEAVP
jgi:hypothetical protein